MHPVQKNYASFQIPTNWNVPRGTDEKLLIFFELLQKWNNKINLISEKNLQPEMFWQRHLLDSLQLAQKIKNTAQICDIGSGGGLPGLVLAAAGFDSIHLIESDLRKCEFLREAARQMSLEIHIHPKRAENLLPDELGGYPEIITARAFAELKDLFEVSHQLAGPHTSYLLLKGRNMQEEVKEAQKNWEFEYHLTPSMTEPMAQLVTITHLVRR